MTPSTRFSAGTDMFGSESNSIAKQYGELGIDLHAASMDRVPGWSAILERLGDAAAGIQPTFFSTSAASTCSNACPIYSTTPTVPAMS